MVGGEEWGRGTDIFQYDEENNPIKFITIYNFYTEIISMRISEDTRR